mmetsp:Transcript_1093/g.3029  ORF Transcript_1093/g.3029 Transcript_1093/m.3029 type:complete len:211 (+) Transcript_1093:3386-4018(+)
MVLASPPRDLTKPAISCSTALVATSWSMACCVLASSASMATLASSSAGMLMAMSLSSACLRSRLRRALSLLLCLRFMRLVSTPSSSSSSSSVSSESSALCCWPPPCRCAGAACCPPCAGRSFRASGGAGGSDASAMWAGLRPAMSGALGCVPLEPRPMAPRWSPTGMMGGMADSPPARDRGPAGAGSVRPAAAAAATAATGSGPMPPSKE